MICWALSLDKSIGGFSELLDFKLPKVFANKLYTLGGNHKWLTIFLFLFSVAIISGFINNTASVAIFIPLAINLCQKFKMSPSKLLLPLSYAAIFGGTLTLIGTSTNLVVSSFMVDYTSNIYPNGIPAFSMFEFTKLGILFLIVGLIYIMFASRWMLHSRSIISSLTRKYHLGPFFTEFKVGPDSQLVGNTVNEMEISENYDIEVYMIIRDKNRIRKGINTFPIQKGDILLAHIAVDKIKKFISKINNLVFFKSNNLRKLKNIKEAKIIFSCLENKDQEIVKFVGGCVRKAINKELIDDIDLATSLKPLEVKEKLLKKEIKVIDTGLSHGTVTAYVGQ